MGSRPNVRPPFVAFSSGVGPIGSEHSENHDVRQDEDLSQADDTGLQTTIEEDMEMNEVTFFHFTSHFLKLGTFVIIMFIPGTI